MHGCSMPRGSPYLPRRRERCPLPPQPPQPEAELRETSMLRELEHLRARAASLEQQVAGQAARVVELEAAIRTTTSALEEGSSMTKLVHEHDETRARADRAGAPRGAHQ